MSLDVLAGPTASGSPANWLVTEDTTITADTRHVDGEVHVTNGATLTLAGSSLLVHGRLVVERNATLVLQPSGDVPARIGPTPGSLDFWMLVNGTLRSAGEPASIIEGLNGEGLKSVVYMPGGLKITGAADVRDLVIQNSSAGVIVEQGGSLVMRDSELKHLYLMGIAAMGHVSLDNVSITNNVIGISGRSTCDVHIRDSYIASQAGNLYMVNCPAYVENTTIDAGIRSNVMNGARSLIHLKDSHVRMYSQAGIGANSEGGRTVLENVTFEPLPGELLELSTNQHGVHAIGPLHATISNASLIGNGGSGIKLETAGVLHVSDSAIHGNGAHGITIGSRVETSLSNVRFIDASGQNPNDEGAISKAVHVPVAVVDADGLPVAGAMRVVAWGDDPANPLFEGEATNGRLDIVFPAYAEASVGGVEELLGPFHYSVEHEALRAPAEGSFAAVDEPIVIPLQSEATGAPWTGSMTIIGSLVFVLVLIFAGALVVRRARAKQVSSGVLDE